MDTVSVANQLFSGTNKDYESQKQKSSLEQWHNRVVMIRFSKIKAGKLGTQWVHCWVALQAIKCKIALNLLLSFTNLAAFQVFSRLRYSFAYLVW